MVKCQTLQVKMNIVGRHCLTSAISGTHCLTSALLSASAVFAVAFAASRMTAASRTGFYWSPILQGLVA